MRLVASSLRALARDWRAGDLRVLVAATAIAVAGIVSVTALGDRMRHALRAQGNELLAADLAVASSFAAPAGWDARARQLGLDTARLVEFRSVVSHGDRTLLAEVKAVSAGYPLRGRLRTASARDARPEVAGGPPPAGETWVEPSLLDALGLSVGDALGVGLSRLEVGAVLTQEPDRGAAAFAVGPRVLMHLADLEATGLVQPGSIVRHRWLVAGPRQAVAELREWLRPRLKSADELVDPSTVQPRLRFAVQRGERFLGLAALVSVLLAGVAIAMAARQFVQRHLDQVALLRCLGARRRTVEAGFAAQLVMLALAAGACGAAAGYGGQSLLLTLLPPVLTSGLPPPGPMPAVAGLAVALVALLGFAMPALLRLRAVSPLRVLRRDLDPPPARLLPLYAAAAAAAAGLVLWIARDAMLAAWAIGSAAGVLVLLTLLAAAGLRLLRGSGRTAPAAWRFGIAALVRRHGGTLAQSVALATGIGAMLLLTVVRQDLSEAWRRTLPPSTPDHFLINIQPDQVQAVSALLREAGLDPQGMVPLVRARILAINGQAVRAADFDSPFAKRMLSRAANLSWRAGLAADNRVVEGRWWNEGANGEPLLSVERDYAQALELDIGDRVTYDVGGVEVTGRVHNLREIDWDSFHPNFFVLMPPGVLEEELAQYLTSVHVPDAAQVVLRELVQRFPNVTVIDVSAILGQVRSLIDRVNGALGYLFLFTVLAGLAVLSAAIQASHDERGREVAVLRALGARHGRLRASLAAEFAALGLLAGTMGAVLAAVTGWVLATQVFGLPYHSSGSLWWLGPAGGVVVVVTAGLLGTRRALRTPAWEALRREG